MGVEMEKPVNDMALRKTWSAPELEAVDIAATAGKNGKNKDGIGANPNFS